MRNKRTHQPDEPNKGRYRQWFFLCQQTSSYQENSSSIFCKTAVMIGFRSLQQNSIFRARQSMFLT